MKKIISVLIILSMLTGCGSGSDYRETSPEQEDLNLTNILPEADYKEIPNAGAEDNEQMPPIKYAIDSEIEYKSKPSEEYLSIDENTDVNTDKESLLTFSLKIDTSSYNNIKRYIESGSLPPEDAVKIEEMINYFNYDEVLEETDEPFSIYTEIGNSPFDENKKLSFVRVKSKDIDKKDLPNSNLTFLIDTSGSMNSFDKLPLLKSAFELLVENLNENDVVSIVTYAGTSSVALDSVHGDSKNKIISSINDLEAGGSTAGADGILTAYELAEKNFIKNGNNRIILATDGDFNVGISNTGDLEKLISEKRESGIYLSILGFGTGNLNDSIMETLSKHGNGNYSYIDSVNSAKKVLVDELSTNLFSIADDVKAQIEFNPDLVSSYRLIGYENRKLNNEDFEDDKKDAGEIGVGTDVILLFEIDTNSELKYKKDNENESDFSDELFEIRIRYKNPGESKSNLIAVPVKNDRILNKNTKDFYFASSVASFGHLLRNSDYTGEVTFEKTYNLAKNNLGKDKGGYRKDFLEILEKYNRIVIN